MADETEDIPEWKRAVLAARAAEAAKEAKSQAIASEYAQDAPELEESTYERTELDDEVDRAVASINVLDAYRRWIGKEVDKHGPNQTRNIMVSCPVPGHRDQIPSASIDLTKGEGGVWACHKECDPTLTGGDKYDIAAIKFGFPIPEYKEGKLFPELKRKMAEDLGVVIPPVSTLTGKPPEVLFDSPEPEPTTQEESGVVHPLGEGVVAALNHTDEIKASGDEPNNVIDFPMPGDYDETFIEYPRIGWESLVTPDGFLGTWMDVTKEDDLPEEFYFWLGLLSLGFAIGRNVQLEDNPTVRGNLYVCLYGPTGQGKSRSIGAMTQLLQKALPYDYSDPESSGAYLVPSPGSAEALVDAFSRPIPDPTDPKAPPIGYGHVRGLVRFDELSTLIGRASRMGNPMKPMLMEFFDGYANVEHKTRGMGHVRAEGHFASTITTTQPRAIRDLLVQTDVDSGFVNRWVFAAGPPKARIAIGRKPLDIDRAVEPLKDVRGWSARVRNLELTSGAIDRWSQFFFDELMPKQDADETGLTARADLILKKIMLLLAADRHKVNVDTEIVDDVIQVWEYLRRSYNMLSGQIGMGPFEDVHQYVIKAMRGFEARYKKPPTMRDLGRAVAHRKFDTEIVIRVVKAMVTMGEAQEVTGVVSGKGQRMTTVRYHYVD